MRENETEVMKYKKKKNQASKSNKRSDHKHIYEKVIVEGVIFGYAWEKRCKICGRIKSESYGTSKEGLMKPRDHVYISEEDYYTLEEVHEKYPDTKIYRHPRSADGSHNWDDDKLIQIY